MASKRSRSWRRRRSHSPDAQVHTWPAWRCSARAADQARPRGDFTVVHREHHIWRFHRRKLVKLKRMSMLSKLKCSGAADPERGGPPYLLGEEAAGESFWWSW
jgi:hypothetical protein